MSPRFPSSLFCVAVLGFASAAGAQVITSDWSTGSGQWHVPENWAPAEVPDNAGGRTYMVQMGALPVAAGAQVDLVAQPGSGVTIAGLTLTGTGTALSTNGYWLSVSGQTLVEGTSTLTVRPSSAPVGLETGTLALAGQGTLFMNGGAAVKGPVTVGPDAQITGEGFLFCGNMDAQADKALDNTGKILCRSHSPADGLLMLMAAGSDTLDLDGSNEQGLVDVSNTGAPGLSDVLTLEVQSPLSDAFSGKLLVGQRDTIRFTKDFALQGADITLTGGDEAARIGGTGKITSATATTFRVSGLGVIANDLTLSGTANKVLMAAPGDALELRGPVTFAGPVTLPVQGGGRLDFSGGLTVNDTVEIQSTGTVSLDGVNEARASVVNVNAPLTVTAGALDAFGKPGFQGADVLTINHPAEATGGQLQVALGSLTDTWSVAPDGLLRLNGRSGAPVMLSGAGVRVEGRMEVTGAVRSAAQLIVPAGGIVDIGNVLRLAGGAAVAPIVDNASVTLSAGTNRLEGGTVGGALFGTLTVDPGRALTGYGRVDARLDARNATVLADGGVLTFTNTMNPAIIGAGLLGATGAGSVLDIPVEWHTGPVPLLWLGGGELRGGAVYLAPGSWLSGFGRVTAPLTVRGTILAKGGTLVLETGGISDLDGTLRAALGTLEIRGGGTLRGLRSHLNIEGGGTIFFNGMGVSMLPNSLTEFVGGTLRSTHPLALTGTVFAHELGGVAPSIVMDGDALLDFGNTSINIFSRLRVTAARAIVRATTRSNSTDGTLVFESGSGVAVESEAILGCSVENHGRMDLGRFPSPAPFSIVGLNQMAGGVLALPLHGPGDLSHVVSAEGVVRLGGTLELTLASGYVPQEGDRLNAITAGNGIIGKFGRIVQPQGMPPGLMFVPEVTLFPDVLHLTATVTTPYEEWRKSYPALTDPESFAKSADPDGDGLPNIGEFALHGNPAGDPAEQNLHPRVITVNSAPVFTCTLAMRAGAVPDPNDPTGGPLVLHQSADSLRYTVQGSPDLTSWNAPVTELTGDAATTLQADLPPLEAAWEYRTFTAGESGKFLRVTVTE